MLVAPGQFSTLRADARFGDGRLAGMWFNARTVWVGRYSRNYRSTADGPDTSRAAAEGWGLLVGLGSSFDYRWRDLPREPDRIASVGLGGPTVEFSTRHGVLMRASFTVQYAFAMVGSLAYLESETALAGQVIKKSLRNGAYYYAHGVVSASTLTVELGPLDLMADGRAAWYWSIDSGDPAQSAIQRQVALRDSRLFLSGVDVVAAFTRRGPVRPRSRARASNQLHARCRRRPRRDGCAGSDRDRVLDCVRAGRRTESNRGRSRGLPDRRHRPRRSSCAPGYIRCRGRW